jgi:hypothetical protein
MGHPVGYRAHPAQLPSAVPPLVTGDASIPAWLPRGQG